MGQPIKIYVGNIPQSARNSELKELFEKFGKVVECDILKEFAFVHMDDTNDAKAAIAGLNDSLWKGSRIRVELSTTKTSKGEPSMRHKLGADDLSRNLRRGRSYERDRARSPPGYMRGNGRDSGRGYDNRFGPNPYRQNDMRGPPMRDSRYGPPHRGRPYPDPYDRRGAYPHDQRIPMRGQAYSPEYQFHPSSYHREPMRDHRAHYVDPYGRPPMSAYGQPMPYYRGPPPNASRYDYSPQGYPNSRPSRYSPPTQNREMYSREISREQPSFNGVHRHVSPSLKSKRHRSSNSRSTSPQRSNRNGNTHNHRVSYSRSPSPVMARARNGHHHKITKPNQSSSRSQSPVVSKPTNGTNNGRSSSRSVSPVQVKSSRRNRKSKKAVNSSASSSANSSFNENGKRNPVITQRVSKLNGHSKKTSRHKRQASSSLSRSRSSTRYSPQATAKV